MFGLVYILAFIISMHKTQKQLFKPYMVVYNVGYDITNIKIYSFRASEIELNRSKPFLHMSIDGSYPAAKNFSAFVH